MTAGEVFVDTNVFAYALDDDAGEKQRVAQDLIDTRRAEITVSTQVLFELHAVCTRKLGMSRPAAAAAVRAVAQFPVVDTDRALVIAAVDLATRAELSIFDAAIVAAAQRAGCRVLLTEDLNDGQDFDGVLIESPFRASEKKV